MKNFLKIVLGTIVGLVIFSILSTFVFFGFIGTIASIGETKPIVYPSSVMTIDMSKIVLTEQTKELDVLSMMQGKSMEVQTLGIYSAVRSINAAAADPSIAYIYMKPDATNGGTAQIEELREALAYDPGETQESDDSDNWELKKKDFSSPVVRVVCVWIAQFL